MCGRNVSLLSRVTPSVLTVSESGTAVPARSMQEIKGKARRRCHEPNKIASDLSGFMAKPLKQNHAYMDERHSSSFSLPDWAVCDKAIWSWVSSAYCCNWIPKCLAILSIGEVNIVNNKGTLGQGQNPVALQKWKMWVQTKQFRYPPTGYGHSGKKLTSLRQSYRHQSS